MTWAEDRQSCLATAAAAQFQVKACHSEVEANKNWKLEPHAFWADRWFAPWHFANKLRDVVHAITNRPWLKSTLVHKKRSVLIPGSLSRARCGGYDTSIIADCPKALDGPFPKIHLRGVAYAEMKLVIERFAIPLRD